MPPPPTLLTDCRVLYIKHLGALLRDSALLAGPAIEAIQQGAGDYFDQAAKSQQRGTFQEEVDGLTASRITLVGEDDLELEIRLDNLSAKLLEATGVNLWKLHLRFITLLNRPDLPKNSNPLGPNSLIAGLEAMFAAAGASALDKKLDLLDRLETNLLENLPALYAEIDSFLDQAGVEGAQPGIVGSPSSPRASAPTPPPSNENALRTLQESLLARLPSLPAQAGTSGAGPADGGAAASLLSQATLERLIFRLNELDRKGGFAPSLASSARPSLETLIPGLFDEENGQSDGRPEKSLNSSELGIPAMAPEGLAIDTLAMIFEAIFAHPGLPDALKAVISSLQITMLKLAMQDASLFTDAAHPARVLLDKMGEAVIGLPNDTPARHPICQRLFAIAGAVRSEFKGDNAVFQQHLLELEDLIAARHAEIARAAEAYIPLIAQLDRRDQAGRKLESLFNGWLARTPEAPIRNFLLDVWQPILTQTSQQHGTDSSPWRQHTEVIDELLWTFEPKSAQEDRKALAKRLPEVLKTIKSGMEHLGVSPEIQANYLDQFFTLQTRALRQGSTPVEAGETALTPLSDNRLRQTPASLLVGKIEADSLVLCTLDFTAAQAAPKQAGSLALNDWLEVQDGRGAKLLGQLCYLSPESGRALIFDPEQAFALSIHPAILSRQLSDGQARQIKAGRLFDDAAQIALQRNRTN